MKMKFKAWLLLACLPFASNADIIKMDVTATITDITEYLGSISSTGRGPHNFYNDNLYVGMTLSASYLYDTKLEKGSTLASDPHSDIYSAVFDVRLKMGNWAFSYDTDWPYSFPPTSSIIVRNDRPNEYFPDTFYASSQQFYNPALDLGPGEEYASLTLSAYSINNTGLESTDIPTTLNIDDFDHRNLRFLQSTDYRSAETRRFLFVSSYIDKLTFTNLSTATQVPAPSTIGMFTFGVLCLARRARVQKDLQRPF